MIGKKINQLATELAPVSTDLTIIGDPVSGVSKKITLAQLGAIFGGAVSFYTTLGDFPVTGVIDIIYCAKDTKKLYLWSGSAYVEVFPAQALLDTYQLRSEKGVSNGYASLDSGGKVPISQLPSSIMEYKGTWNAATNTPTLANGTGDTGDVYICNVAGTVNFGAGPITFAVGDYVIYSGSIWQRSSGAVGTVTSVAVTRSGDALAITGSPITTSGTINIGFAGTGAQYIKGDGTLATFPSIISQAQNLITEVYNNTGATLTKGTIVYINGGQGNLPTVTKALATSDATSAQTYGIIQTDITNMNNGYVVVEGRLGDLDTQAYANGTQLYLSPTTAGTWTSTKSYAPNHLVYVGIVVRSHPTQGVVEVKIMNGFEMDELHNVAAQSPDNNDILQYKTATSLWTKVAGTTTNIAEGSNLYYTDARSRAALSFTAGSGAYNSTTGVITIPTNTNQLTNGAAFITLASLSAGAGISYNNTTGVIASTITQYTDALARAAISLTTTGTSGAATYNSTTGVLNIPNYAPDLSGYVPTSRTLTINGTAFDLSANRSWSVGTVTSVGLSSATSGVTIGSTPITTSGTITLAIATASGSQQGLLSSTDWTTFNNKQNALTNPVTGTGTTNYLPKFTGTSTIGNSIASESGNVFIVATSGESRINVRSGASNGIALTFTESGIADRYLIGSPASSGDLVFRSGSFNFSSGTETMRLTASGNLSIGNTNDSFRLDVSGTGRFFLTSITNPALRLDYNSTSNYGRHLMDANGNYVISSPTSNGVTSGNLVMLAGNNFNVFTNNNNTANTPQLTVNTSGNLGLGVTPSAWISGNLAFEIVSASGLSSDGTSIRMQTNAFVNTSGSWQYKSNGAASFYTTGAGSHAWYIAPSGTAGNAISFTQAMTLNASGNLSIGNTNDSFRLDVSGTGRFVTSGNNIAIFESTNANGGYITFRRSGNDFLYIGNSSAVGGGANMTDFYTTAGLGMRFFPNAGGAALTLATTGAATFSSSVTASYYDGAIFRVLTSSTFRGGVGTGSWAFADGSNDMALTSDAATKIGAGGTERMRITSGGDVEINTGSIKTGEPGTGWGRAAIRIGASVSGAAFNVTRYLPVNVDGTVYFINLNSSTP